jgi:hypothetical protein
VNLDRNFKGRTFECSTGCKQDEVPDSIRTRVAAGKLCLWQTHPWAQGHIQLTNEDALGLIQDLMTALSLTEVRIIRETRLEVKP